MDGSVEAEDRNAGTPDKRARQRQTTPPGPTLRSLLTPTLLVAQAEEDRPDAQASDPDH